MSGMNTNTVEYEAIPSGYKTVTCLVCQSSFLVPTLGDEGNALRWKQKLYEIAKLDTDYLHLNDNRYSFCNGCQKQIHLLEELSINFENIRQSLKNISTEICIAVLRVNINMGNPISDRLTQSFEEWNKDRLFDMLSESKLASSMKTHETSVVIESLQNVQSNQHANEIAAIAANNIIAQLCDDVRLPMVSAETVLVSNNPVGDVYDNVVFPTTTENLNTDSLVGNYGDILNAALSNVLVPELTDTGIVGEDSTSYAFLQGLSGGTTTVVEIPLHLDTTSTMSFSTLSDANSQINELNSSQSGTTNDDSKAESKAHQCKFCKFSYTRKDRLNSHVKKCHPNSEEGITEVPKSDVVKCSHCSKTFARMYSLRKHEQRVHGVKNFSCDKCQKMFSTNSLLQIHRKRHDGPSFKCPICKRFLFQKKSLRHHVNMHYEKDAITPHPICEVCNKEMNTPAVVMSHIEAHKDIVYTSEPIIKIESVKKPPNVPKPIEIQRTETFSCDVCKTLFQDKQLLHIHMKTHVKAETFLCEECGECFITQQHLYNHQQTHKPNQFKCEVCQKLFKKRWNLKNHMDIHTNTVYHCQECNLPFKRKTSLNIHMRKHSGSAQYKCSLCSHDGFSYQMGLRKHLYVTHPEVYLKIKKFLCEICYKVFAKEKDLEKHKIIHEKHKCKLCNRQFKMLHHLNEHLLRHAELRLFKCSCCEKSFLRKRLLMSHIKKRHPNHNQEERETEENATFVVTFE